MARCFRNPSVVRLVVALTVLSLVGRASAQYIDPVTDPFHNDRFGRPGKPPQVDDLGAGRRGAGDIGLGIVGGAAIGGAAYGLSKLFGGKGGEGKWTPGASHPKHSNVVASPTRGVWWPSPGYKFVAPGTKNWQTVWDPGQRHPDHPNVVADSESNTWVPERGYDWVTPGQTTLTDWRVTWQPGTPHPDHPNVVAGPTPDVWWPSPGYKLVAPGTTWETVWEPGQRHRDHENVVAGDAPGEWRPAPGYRAPGNTWVMEWEPGQRHGDHPNVVAGSEPNTWVPERGYDWVTPGQTTLTDWRVTLPPGTPHPDHPNVVRGSWPNTWRPAPGYDWTTLARNDWSVTWQPGTPHPEHPNVVAGPTPDVWWPSPGYKLVAPGTTWETVWEPGQWHRDYDHVVAGSAPNTWSPAPGYDWVTPGQTTITDWRVAWQPGTPHPEFPNVFAGGPEGTWAPPDHVHLGPPVSPKEAAHRAGQLEQEWRRRAGAAPSDWQFDGQAMGQILIQNILDALSNESLKLPRDERSPLVQRLSGGPTLPLLLLNRRTGTLLTTGPDDASSPSDAPPWTWVGFEPPEWVEFTIKSRLVWSERRSDGVSRPVGAAVDLPVTNERRIVRDDTRLVRIGNRYLRADGSLAESLPWVSSKIYAKGLTPFRDQGGEGYLLDMEERLFLDPAELDSYLFQVGRIGTSIIIRHKRAGFLRLREGGQPYFTLLDKKDLSSFHFEVLTTSPTEDNTTLECYLATPLGGGAGWVRLTLEKGVGLVMRSDNPALALLNGPDLRFRRGRCEADPSSVTFRAHGSNCLLKFDGVLQLGEMEVPEDNSRGAYLFRLFFRLSEENLIKITTPPAESPRR
jgi:hypothetical protein